MRCLKQTPKTHSQETLFSFWANNSFIFRCVYYNYISQADFYVRTNDFFTVSKKKYRVCVVLYSPITKECKQPGCDKCLPYFAQIRSVNSIFFLSSFTLFLWWIFCVHLRSVTLFDINENRSGNNIEVSLEFTTSITNCSMELIFSFILALGL